MQPRHTLELTTDSETATRALAYTLAQAVRAGDLISLCGDLGAGKTRFVQGLAAGLGITEIVNSPTFTIVRLYNGRLPLYHFDLYRVKSDDELERLGADEYFYGSGVTIIEWGDKAGQRLPPDHLRLEIHRALDLPDRRVFIVQSFGDRSDQLLAELGKAA